MESYDYAAADPAVVAHLDNGSNPRADRIRWMLALPDLTRRPVSPVKFLVEQALAAPCLAGADRVSFPEVISTRRNFDLLNSPPDHPSRRPSDTYYIDDDHVLRTQTTSMWTWYLTDAAVRAKLVDEGSVTGVSYGKVYRNDEIDRSHYPVFHQIDALHLCHRRRQVFGTDDLDAVLEQIAATIYGAGVVTRLSDDSFPFTEPSRQLEVQWQDDWLELVGAGLVHEQVLANLGLDPAEYNGWAFGFGLDRLAMRKMNIPDIRILWSDDERIQRQFTSIDSQYEAVSKYPPTLRDISFVIAKDRALTDFYEIVRDSGRIGAESIVEAVEHVDTYADAKRFGADKISQTFRIVYRSFLRTLTNDEINAVQAKIRALVVTELKADLR